MRSDMFLLVFAALSIACGESSTNPPASTSPNHPPPNPTAKDPPEAPPNEGKTGVWTKLDLGTNADVSAVFTPKDGLAFFGTREGMYRFDGKAVAKVDLGCACTVADFDRDSGLAIGTDGPNVYAGVFDRNTDSYASFAWKTDREGPKPARVSGDASSFVYVPERGSGKWTVSYHPTALLGGPVFGTEAQGGDLLSYADTAIAVAGTAEQYWVAGGRGMYAHTDNYAKVTEGDYAFVDVWNGWALRVDGLCNGSTCSGPPHLFRLENGAWVKDLEVKNPHGTPIRFFIQATASAIAHVWILGQRADGGVGTGADPIRYGAALGHVDDKLAWRWVDFPKEEELVAAAFSSKEGYIVGKKGLVYRCVQPGCSAETSAPK